jgi:hypothetical protein
VLTHPSPAVWGRPADGEPQIKGNAGPVEDYDFSPVDKFSSYLVGRQLGLFN